MQLNAEFYDLMMETSGAVFGAFLKHREPPTEPRPLLLQVRGGRAESPGWYMVQAAEFHPEPLTVERLRVRDTYASEGITRALLEMLASECWLERINNDEYCLTDEGQQIVDRIKGLRVQIGEVIEPLLKETDVSRLENLLSRLIKASLEAPTPPGNWCLRYSRCRAPKEDAPNVTKIIQYFEDFNAFRDDAHMAAFQLHDVPGFAWEAFSHIYQGDMSTVEALHEALAYRGYSPSEYRAALDDLCKRGWLELANDAGSYRIVDKGRTAREEAEHLTDDYFYAPWQNLSENEIGELETLLYQLRDEAKALAE